MPNNLPAEPTSRDVTTQLIKIAADIANRRYVPSLDDCRTLRHAHQRVNEMSDRHGQLAYQLKELVDRLDAVAQSAKLEALEKARELVAKWNAQAQDMRCQLHSGPSYTAHIPKHCSFCVITECAKELAATYEPVGEEA